MTRQLPPSLLRTLGRIPHGASAPFVPTPAPTENDAIESDGDGDSESFSKAIHWQVGAGEVSVYTTRRKWRALDVHLAITPILFNSYLVFTVRVYAVLAGGLRVLVESGRLGLLHSAAFVAPSRPSAWVAAARTQASKFEVTIEAREVTGPGTPPFGDLTVAIVAGNDALPAPDSVGAIRLSEKASANLSTAGIVDPEIVALHAVPMVGVAAPRYLHVHDVASTAFAVAGAVPAFSLPICGPTGAPAGDGMFAFRFRSTEGIFLVFASSTADVTTAVGDCILQAVVR